MLLRGSWAACCGEPNGSHQHIPGVSALHVRGERQLSRPQPCGPRVGAAGPPRASVGREPGRVPATDRPGEVDVGALVLGVVAARGGAGASTLAAAVARRLAQRTATAL